MPAAVIIIAAWVAIGLATALWMARRGHRDPGWLAMCILFGPAMAVAATERVQRRPEMLSLTRTGEGRPGRMRVLVGLDGSAASHSALDLAISLLGPHADTLVVAEVVDYDAAELDASGRPDGRLRVAKAQERLDAAAARRGECAMDCEVLVGPPAETLRRFAEEQDIDLIVVGALGRGVSKRLLGSVSRALVADGGVPVLVAGSRTAQDRTPADQGTADRNAAGRNAVTRDAAAHNAVGRSHG
ncbi:universal stress protein [Streptomyces sp. 549]|uniref:universal stress protein n=1 Tax=Streptomyces sp. 549 TaxID=3049076 RepID=UPI0024C3E2B6|nr:universal stress protein [Streptomyces sp. 549]MDK1476232.1 universal stress protein [Streptomyces sp. 549]